MQFHPGNARSFKNWKLLTKSWRSPMAFAIYLCGDWVFCMQLSTFDTPEKSSGWTTGMRLSVLQENWWNSYFQELILRAQCLHLLISNKSTKSLHGDISSSSLAENLFSDKCLTAWTLPSPESHKLTFPHTPPLWSSLSEPSRCCLQGGSPHFAPNKT